MDDQRLANWVGAGALGLVLAAVVWLLVSPGSGSGGSDELLQVNGTQPVAGAAHHQAQNQLQGCVDAATALKLPLRRASSSVNRWDAHVGAMNKRVAGTITAKQLKALWDRTGMKAHRKVAAFERALAQLKRNGVHCPSPATLPSHAAPGLRSCAHEVALGKRALHTARTTIDTWRRHVRVLRALQAGKVAQPTTHQVWSSLWGRGQRHMKTYRSAAHDARDTSACVIAPPPPAVPPANATWPPTPTSAPPSGPVPPAGSPATPGSTPPSGLPVPPGSTPAPTSPTTPGWTPSSVPPPAPSSTPTTPAPPPPSVSSTPPVPPPPPPSPSTPSTSPT